MDSCLLGRGGNETRTCLRTVGPRERSPLVPRSDRLDAHIPSSTQAPLQCSRNSTNPHALGSADPLLPQPRSSGLGPAPDGPQRLSRGSVGQLSTLKCGLKALRKPSFPESVVSPEAGAGSAAWQFRGSPELGQGSGSPGPLHSSCWPRASCSSVPLRRRRRLLPLPHQKQLFYF